MKGVTSNVKQLFLVFSVPVCDNRIGRMNNEKGCLFWFFSVSVCDNRIGSMNNEKGCLSDSLVFRS